MRDDSKLANALVLPRPIEWIYIAAGLALVVRYRWFMDDAFVYFRYVDNLLFLEIGLVYNAGEYVEGFTSPLWLMLLVPLRALGLGFPAIVLGVGLAAFAATAYGLVVLNRRLAPSGPIVNLPLAFLACNYSVTTYFTGGLETPLLQALAVAFALFLIFPRNPLLQTVVALSPLARHEMLLALLVALWATRRAPGVTRRVSTVAGAALGAWLAFRVWYYAELLPNTFYLKDDWEILRGLAYVHRTLATYQLYLPGLVLLLFAVLPWRRGARSHGALRLAMVATTLPVVLYVIKVGGASIDYRYLAFPFCLAVASAAGLVEAAASRVLAAGSRRWAPILGLATAAVSLVLYPAQLDRHPLRREVQVTTLGGVNDPQWHRAMIEKWHEDWYEEAAPVRQRQFRAGNQPFRYSRVARAGLCVGIYETFDHRVVHLYGLTDPILARVEAEAHKPGHKRDLRVLSRDLLTLRKAGATDRGGLARAVAEGQAPSWVESNLETLEAVERKLYNRHRPLENLRLALTPLPRIELDESTRGRIDAVLSRTSTRTQGPRR